MSRQTPSDDPRIQIITACWRHLRHIEHPSCPDGSSPPKTEEMASIIAGLYGLEDEIKRFKNKHDQLWGCYEYIFANELPHHKLGKNADRHPAKIIRGKPESAKSTKQKSKDRAPPRPRRESSRRTTYAEWVMSPAFLRSTAWISLRYDALDKYGGRCMVCGVTAEDGYVINVDHIKCRKDHPELALNIENLQITCGLCNRGKGNRHSTDWRPAARAEREAAIAAGPDRREVVAPPVSGVQPADLWEDPDRALDESFLNAMAAE